MRIPLLFIFLSPIISCAPIDRGGLVGADEEISLRIEYPGEGGDAPYEGAIIPVRLTIANPSSSQCLLLNAITGVGLNQPAVRWQFAAQGAITYRKEEDAFYLAKKGTAVTEEVFSNGLLTPKEKRSVVLNVRLLNLPKRMELTYALFPARSLSQQIYFPSLVDEDYAIFKKYSSQKVDAMLSLSRKDSPVPEERKQCREFFETVIFNPSLLHSWKKLSIPIDTPVRKRPFSLEDACRKIALPLPVDHTYVTSLKCWAIRSGEKMWLVNERTTISIHALPMEIFEFLDTLQEAVAVEIEVDIAVPFDFSERHNVIARKEGIQLLSFILVEKSKFLEFVRDADTHGLTLSYSNKNGRDRILLKKQPSR